MSHPGMHEAFEAERKKQLTDKERAALRFALRRLAAHERESVLGGLMKCNDAYLTSEEMQALCVKIFDDGCPSP